MAVKDSPADPEFEALIRYIQESHGLDFRGYKRTSLERRIRRRMEEVGREDYTAYHEFLEAHPQEFVDLLNTVLINVTSFFRDKEAWDVLKAEVLPKILMRKGDCDPIRIWSVGCATGEEPYSLSILLAELLGQEDFCRRVKIYATDLDEAALSAARHASYLPRDVENVPPELLEKYFERTNTHYVFQRELRKCVIFGRHNIVSDAPISRIDLLVCRNLLIYLESDTQGVVLPRLHYALVNSGFLFLGKAETQLARTKMFEPVDLKSRIFRKLPQEWRRSLGGSLALAPDPQSNRSDMQTRMLEAIVDSSHSAYLSVNPDGMLVFANANARRLFEIGESDIGRPFQDLAVSYRPVDIRSHIDEVLRSGRSVRIENLDFQRVPGEAMRLNLEVSPLVNRDGKTFATLLTFSDVTRIYTLQQELEIAQENLETTIEELQSTIEELETMNEELRSANEELEVTNEELRRHGDEAADYRRYAESVLRSMGIGIIVMDRDMRIRS
jgi:two-component system CheB/CheR fusion protein